MHRWRQARRVCVNSLGHRGRHRQRAADVVRRRGDRQRDGGREGGMGRYGEQLIRLRIRTLAAVSLWPQTHLLLLLSLCVCWQPLKRQAQCRREREGGFSATKPSLSSRLAKQLDAEKFIGEQLRCSPPTPNPKKPDDSLVERRSECEGLPPHPFMGRRGRCPLLCHRSNLSDPMINCWKITCIKRPKTASTAAHRLRSSFRKFMFNNLMLSPRGLPRIFMMRH